MEVKGKADVGYTFIEKIGAVFHVWNDMNDYYINDTGLQLTNHNAEYWSHNIWGLRVKIGESWHIRWSDGLNWNWKNETDFDNHYVELNGTSSYSEGSYSATFRVRYYLADHYQRINISLGLKNTGSDITDMDFGWLTKNIRVGSDVENDTVEVVTWVDSLNHTKGFQFEHFNLNSTNNAVFSDSQLAKRQCFVIDSEKAASLELLWSQYGWKDFEQKNMTYKLFINSTEGQFNGKILLLLNIGSLNNGQTAYTNFLWIDAATITNNPSSDTGVWSYGWFGYLSDNKRASESDNGGLHYYYNYDFNSNLPSEATITKVELGLEHYESLASQSIFCRISWDNGASWSTETEVHSVSETTDWVDFTSATEWTPSKLYDPNLRARVRYDMSGSGCFAPETLVRMADGSLQQIKTLNEGDMIFSYNGEKQMITKFTPHLNEKPLLFYNITVESGSSLVVWGGHEIPVAKNLDSILVKEISVGDYVLNEESKLVQVTEVSTLFLTEFYNIVVEDSLFYANGILIHNAVKLTAFLDWIPVRVTYTVVTYFVTFYFHLGGTLLVNGTNTANGTTNEYESASVANITGVANATYEFYNHTYDSSETTDNPFYLTVSHNFTVHSYFLSFEAFNPTGETLLGSTTQISGVFPDALEENDQIYKVFRAYESTIGSDTTDYVDNNSSDVDGVEYGTHSNFPAEQSAPDSMYDVLTEEDTELGGGIATIVELWVNGFTWDEEMWFELGTDPYLNGTDDSSYLYVAASDLQYESRFNFTDSLDLGTINDVEICLYARNDVGDDGMIEVYLWNSTNGPYSVAYYTPNAGSYSWNNFSVVSTLPSWSEINVAQLRVRAERVGGADNLVIDASLIRVNYSTPSENYQLDLEVQWTSADYDEANEYLCIYGGTMGAEDLSVDVRSGGSWINLISALSNGWNNVSVSSYLTSAVFTIRFKGTVEAGDTTQHTWEIDSALLHTWTIAEYTIEVEFTGTSNSASWVKLRWTVDSALTNASVSVALQLYNYNSSEYPTSGDGYISYTSSETPNTDELKTQTISSNPSYFRSAVTYEWKLKVTTVIGTLHDWKGDWIEYRVFTYPTLVEEEDLAWLYFVIVVLSAASGYLVLAISIGNKINNRKI